MASLAKFRYHLLFFSRYIYRWILCGCWNLRTASFNFLFCFIFLPKAAPLIPSFTFKVICVPSHYKKKYFLHKILEILYSIKSLILKPLLKKIKTFRKPKFFKIHFRLKQSSPNFEFLAIIFNYS